MGYRNSGISAGFQRAALNGCLVLALAFLFAGSAVADSNAGASRNRLVGAWVVRVTLTDCSTNAPAGPPFQSLVSFHDGGTITEDPGGSAFAPGQRSGGHGTWSRVHGKTYSQSMVGLIRFDTAPNLPGTPGFNPSLPITPGFFAGWQTILQEVKLSDADNFTSVGANAFYRADGALYRTGCSTAVGKRFE